MFRSSAIINSLFLCLTLQAEELKQARSEHAMISTADVRASQIGIDMLKQGGNAADAAVAVSFAISVLRPQSTGIGGGGFALVRMAKDKKVEVYDFRERAPALAHRDMYLEEGKVIKDKSRQGIASAGSPGLVKGIHLLHKEHGHLSWADCVSPSIKLAAKGFVVNKDLGESILRKKEMLNKDPQAAKIFNVKEGELLIQKNLAETLRKIQQDPETFYHGFFADALDEYSKDRKGFLRKEDLHNYRVKKHKPIHAKIRGLDVYTMPPPSSGGIHLVQMLKALEHVKAEEEFNHYLIEIMRQAFADRAYYMGDPAFVDIPGFLTSDDYTKVMYDTVQETARESKELSHGIMATTESESTTHFSIIDAEGNCVSSTQTINYLFGSGVMVPGTGVFLNDEMDDFSINPGVPNLYGLIGGEANAVAPGKTPLSSMTPTIILKEGEPYLVLGSPGGPRIITAVLQVFVNIVFDGMKLDEAVVAGRLHQQWFPDKVFIEKEKFSADEVRVLEEKGHNLVKNPFYMGDIQAIIKEEDDSLWGVSDIRMPGAPLGY